MTRLLCMDADRDTFARFVEVLSDSLDDPDLSGDGLAAMLHLSRFHCDRLLRAAAGEAPGALRRRVLLERSAYRLAASADSILDVATGAGYGSHEAYTRAFVKAYGRTPSAWRARPGQPWLDAPNGVHFHPPGALRLPGTREERTMELVMKMVDHHVWMTGQIVAKAVLLPETDLDGAIEVSVDDGDDVGSLRALCSRLVGQMEMWLAAVASRPYDFAVEDHEPVTSIRERYERVGPEFIAEVAHAMADGAINDTFVNAFRDGAEVFTYGQMIAHVLNFSAYRRTLAVLRLRQLGDSELGWGDPMTFVDHR